MKKSHSHISYLIDDVLLDHRHCHLGFVSWKCCRAYRVEFDEQNRWRTCKQYREMITCSCMCLVAHSWFRYLEVRFHISSKAVNQSEHASFNFEACLSGHWNLHRNACFATQGFPISMWQQIATIESSFARKEYKFIFCMIIFIDICYVRCALISIIPTFTHSHSHPHDFISCTILITI